MEIQELIARGRIIFVGAPKRLQVFAYINGKRNAKDIAIKVGKPVIPTLDDIRKIRDMGLITPKKDGKGNIIKKEGSTVYEKVSPLRHISISYFKDPIKAQKEYGKRDKKSKQKKFSTLSLPSEMEIIKILNDGEDQLYEFKEPGIENRKITKEITAFLNTKMGGFIFYGVDDDGVIIGTDKRRQDLDPPIQNSIKSCISPPPPPILIKEKDVLGKRIIIIIVSPWNRKEVYHYEGRVLIRKGTTVLTASPQESKKLHNGEYVI